MILRRHDFEGIVHRHIREKRDQHDDVLAPEWTETEPTNLLWTMLSVRNWEPLTFECGYSTSQYVAWMQTLARRAFVCDRR